MSEEKIVKKVLFAEDYPNTIRAWLRGLQRHGLDLGGQEINAVIDRGLAELVILPIGNNELHFSSNARVIDQLGTERRYDAVFMDGEINVGTTHRAVSRYLQDPNGPVVYLMSGSLALQTITLQREYGVDIDALFAQGNRLFCVRSDFDQVERHLATILGFSIEEPGRGPQIRYDNNGGTGLTS